MVKRIHTELGTTFVYVTHDQTEALALGERILIMKDGRVLQDGTPAQIYTGPNCVDAALALGTPPMNLFPDLPSEDGFVTLLGVRVPLPEGVNGPVSVGIRPVHIQPGGRRHSGPDRDRGRAWLRAGPASFGGGPHISGGHPDRAGKDPFAGGHASGDI